MYHDASLLRFIMLVFSNAIELLGQKVPSVRVLLDIVRIAAQSLAHGLVAARVCCIIELSAVNARETLERTVMS